jgi:hypothetical protein
MTPSPSRPQDRSRPPADGAPLRLLVHIGAGKTGTTAIQQCLAGNRDALRAQGTWYLGIMLEDAPVQRYSWQSPGAIKVLEALPPAQAIAEVLAVLRESAPLLRAAGCTRAIWSNESLLNHVDAVLPALRQLAGEGWAPELVAYVRRHDRWIRSAYVQWGIRHKVEAGPVLPFAKWARTHRPRFHASIQRWIDGTGFPCSVRNFDAVPDVVPDFLQFAGLSVDELRLERFNDTPGPEELLLRLLFNNLHADPVLPNRFNDLLLDGRGARALDPGALLASYLPTQQELRAVARQSVADATELNVLLAAAGQPLLEAGPENVAAPARPDVDPGRLATVLFEMLVHQARRIEALESRLDAMSAGAPIAAKDGQP